MTMESKTLRVKVERVEQLSPDIKAFELMGLDGSSLPEFSPGAHIDVHMGADLSRPYSLCNGPGDAARYLIAVKKEPNSRRGSRFMHEEVRAGQVLSIGRPRNHFPLQEDAKQSLLLGAGIGVTPLLCMARHLQARGAAFEMQYFCRSAAHAAFRDVLSSPAFEGKVSFQYGLDASAVQAHLRELLKDHPEGAHLYLCGPRPFMDMVESAAAPLWPQGAIHREYFSADLALAEADQNLFEVALARSGRSFLVPEGKSITDVLKENGVAVDMSCEQGVCGTCLTRVISGIPDHRDMFLSDEEKARADVILPCVSRCKSPKLVLDL